MRAPSSAEAVRSASSVVRAVSTASLSSVPRELSASSLSRHDLMSAPAGVEGAAMRDGGRDE